MAAVAGGVAGSSILFLEPETRRNVALYIGVRALQCLYNAAKARGWWHMWGSHWSHGDTLLFCVTSAQVMYAYVMRPDTLPSSYNKFIIATGPIHTSVLQAVRDQVRVACNTTRRVQRVCAIARPQWVVVCCRSVAWASTYKRCRSTATRLTHGGGQTGDRRRRRRRGPRSPPASSRTSAVSSSARRGACRSADTAALHRAVYL